LWSGIASPAWGSRPSRWGGLNIEIDRDAGATIVPLDLDRPDPGTVEIFNRSALAIGLTATLCTGAALYLCAAFTLLARRRQLALS
jgi:hypothetical protein